MNSKKIIIFDYAFFGILNKNVGLIGNFSHYCQPIVHIYYKVYSPSECHWPAKVNSCAQYKVEELLLLA